VCTVQQLALERSQERLRSALQGWTDRGWAWEHCQGDTWRATSTQSDMRPGGGGDGVLQVHWHRADHTVLLSGLEPSSVSLVVFNLGYLPGGNKEIVTGADGTVEALRAAERAVCAGGTCSATLYPGHPEGRLEEAAVLQHAADLPFGQWSVHYTQWLNQRNKKTGGRAPSLCLMQRLNEGGGPRSDMSAPGAPMYAPWEGEV
jgi:hypothetical protein